MKLLTLTEAMDELNLCIEDINEYTGLTKGAIKSILRRNYYKDNDKIMEELNIFFGHWKIKIVLED